MDSIRLEAIRPGPIIGALHATAAAAWATLGEWRRRYRSRRALEEMSPVMLRDIGLGPGDALHEARKPFWRA